MPVDAKELAHRLRSAREAARLTQEQVAGHLGVSRSSIAQIELGNRAVSSLELKRLADLYGRDLGAFLADEFDESDALVALFRVHPEMAEDPALNEVLRRCAVLCREATGLEGLLQLDEKRVLPAEYQLPPPRGRWEAIQQGEHVASLERRRLDIGHAPVLDVPGVLEPQGVRCAEVPMPADISGLFLVGGKIGLCIVVNSDHHLRRRAFSYAHEYCHLLLDRGRRGNVSRQANRDELIEVRANAFAASFLLPADGVFEFLRSLGKGEEARTTATVSTVFEDTEPLAAQHRTAPRSQDIQLYDLVHLAHRFGVSFEAAVHRLRNLRFVSEEEKDRLLAHKEDAATLQRALDMAEDEKRPDRRSVFRHQFLALALEAYRRELISRRKLAELGQLLGLSEENISGILRTLGLDGDIVMGPEDVRLPE